MCQYWIVKGRTAVKKVIRACLTCSRHAARVPTQLMGELPKATLLATMVNGISHYSSVPSKVVATAGSPGVGRSCANKEWAHSVSQVAAHLYPAPWGPFANSAKMGGMFGIQRNADPENVFLCASSRQHEFASSRQLAAARAVPQPSSSTEPGSPHSSLATRRSLPLHRTTRRPTAPCCTERKFSLQATTEREQQHMYAQRHEETSIKLTLSPHEILSFLNLQSTIHTSVIIKVFYRLSLVTF